MQPVNRVTWPSDHHQLRPVLSELGESLDYLCLEFRSTLLTSGRLVPRLHHLPREIGHLLLGMEIACQTESLHCLWLEIGSQEVGCLPLKVG